MRAILLLVVAIVCCSASANTYEVIDAFDSSIDTSLPNGMTRGAIMSEDGRWCYVYTESTNAVDAFGPLGESVVLVDLSTGQQRFVTKDFNGRPISGYLLDASADGNVALLHTYSARDLGFPEFCCANNNLYYLYDRRTDSTRLITYIQGQPVPYRMGAWPDLSPCGRYVVFTPQVYDTQPNPFGTDDLVRYDLQTDTWSSILANPVEQTLNSISREGRYFAFSSLLDTLTAGLPSDHEQVFIYDFLFRQFTRVTEANGVPGNGPSKNSKFSHNGEHLFFESNANNIAPGDFNSVRNVLRYTVSNGTRTICDALPSGAALSTEYGKWAIDATGEWFLFGTPIANFLPGLAAHHIIRRNLSTNDYAAVNRTWSGALEGSQSPYPSVQQVLNNGDRFLLLTSNPNWIQGDTGTVDPIFRDISAGVNHRALKGFPCDVGSWWTKYAYATPGQDRFAVFSTQFGYPTTLGFDYNLQVYLRDRVLKRTTLISKSPAGGYGNNWNFYPTVDRSGTKVAFVSVSTNLGSSVTAWRQHIYLADLTANTVRLVTQTPSGVQANADTDNAYLTPDGRYIYMFTRATNLGNSSTGAPGGFLRYDIANSRFEPYDLSAPGHGPVAGPIPRFTSDMRYAIFASNSPAIDPSSNGTYQVYVRDMTTGVNHLVSTDSSGAVCDQSCGAIGISENGRRVGLYSNGWNTYGHASTELRMYIKDLDTGELRLASKDQHGEPRGLTVDYLHADISDNGRYLSFPQGTPILWEGRNGAQSGYVYYDYEEDRILPIFGDQRFDHQTAFAMEPIFIGSENEAIVCFRGGRLLSTNLQSGWHAYVDRVAPHVFLSGHISFTDFVGNVPEEVSLDLYDPSGNFAGFFRELRVEDSGDYHSEYAVDATGSHYGYLKMGTWLGSRVGPFDFSIQNTNVDFRLVNGDCDGDNEIGPGDFGALSAAFGSRAGDPHWNASADLDGNQEVDAADFSIIATNFGQTGDTVVP